MSKKDNNANKKTISKPLLIVGVLILIAVFLAYFFARQEPPQDISVSQKELLEYFPMKENVTYEYAMEDSETTAYKTYNSFVGENALQQVFIANSSFSDNVIKLVGDEVKLVHSSDSNFFYNSNLESEWIDDATILKAPLKKGTKWTTYLEEKCEITGVDIDVSVPYGDFKAIEVTSEIDRQGDGEVLHYKVKAYYAKGIGKIKEIQEDNKGNVYSIVLKSYTEDSSEILNINIYYPDETLEELIKFQASVELKTGITGKEIFETVLKSEDAPLLTPNTKINSLDIVWLDNDTFPIIAIDLSKEFILEFDGNLAQEQALLQALTNTLGYYAGIQNVHLTIDGENYSSKNNDIHFGDNQYLQVLAEGATE